MLDGESFPGWWGWTEGLSDCQCDEVAVWCIVYGMEGERYAGKKSRKTKTNVNRDANGGDVERGRKPGR